MSSSLKLCVDASLISRIITGSVTPEITQLLDEWNRIVVSFIAPSLIGYEIANSLHRKIADGLDDLQIRTAFEFFDGLNIETVRNSEIHLEALTFASRFRHAAAYDAHYLAVSSRYAVDLWTCDRRLYNSVKHELDWVHYVSGTMD